MAESLIGKIARFQNIEEYRDLHWQGSFEDYLSIVREDPRVCRTAYQRVYDMILSKGREEYIDNKKKIVRYNFFSDPKIAGRDAIFGMDIPLMRLVEVFRSAAQGYGTERRVILLHGPVGSSKSTIARLIKNGVQEYSRTDEGRLYTYEWVLPESLQHVSGGQATFACPMNEDPLKLIPEEWREKAFSELGIYDNDYVSRISGDLNPACRMIFRELMQHYKGDWRRVVDHIRVRRLVLSEKDRVGIGTFQPKDEKNQDSTELTGDINYRKIAVYGSDSDPRCVAPSTLVATSEGLTEIVSLLDDPNLPADTFTPRALAVSTSGAQRVGLAGSVYSAGAQPMRRIQTRLGYEITATPNHMLLTMTPGGDLAWKELRLLEAGDYVALGRGVHTWSTEDAPLPPSTYAPYGNERQQPHFPDRMSPSLAYLLGLWIGDGHLYLNPAGHQYEFAWTQMEPAHCDRFAALARDLFGLDMRPTFRDGQQRGLSIGNRALVEWLQASVGLKHGAQHKAIPACILTSSRASLIACLQGLWETDGTIRENNGSNWAMFATCSEVLARQVHTALLALGVVASLKRAPSDWEVRVYGQNVNRLCDLIPSLRDRFTVGAPQSAKPAPNVDIVPHVKPKLRRLFQLADNRDALKTRYSGNLHDRHKPNVSYDLLTSFLQDVQASNGEAQALLQSLRHVLDQHHVWLPVTSTQDLPEGRAFDLSVARTHAYWADGFVSHNCFNFDGEFNVANRGVIEFIEVLKLDVAFLYDLLGATQERKIKPKKFAQTDIDEVILAHTNEPEYKKLVNNEYMEALRDRTVKIDIPYITKWSEEIKIYKKDYNAERIRGKHIAPHTIEMAAMWAVLTRLEDPKKHNLSLLQKLKLYDGKTIAGYTQENVKELRKEAEREGMEGISPRYVQGKISSALVSEKSETSINPFLVLNEIEAGLRHHSLITNEEERTRYRELLNVVRQEYEDIVKNEVQRAISADEDAIQKLCSNYIDNIKAYTQREKVRNRFTSQYEEPDERLMRSIEEKIEIPESRKEDFRREIMNYIGALAIEGKTFDWRTNDRLRKALELKMFEDQKDTIKLTTMVSNVVDKDTQEKIDIVKQRLIRSYGYNEESATDILNFVASIFARGDSKG